MPPLANCSSPVSQPESSEARKTATEAMSPGWPVRPSGVCATSALFEVAADEAGGVRAFGFDDAGIDGVDANLFRGRILSRTRR